MPKENDLPSIKVHKNAPAFLIEKFKRPSDLIRNSLALSDIPAEGLDESEVRNLLPTFDDMFHASDNALLGAIKSVIVSLPPEKRENASRRFLKHAKRLMVFKDLDELRKALRPLIARNIKEMPRNLTELEISGGGRDILDPFIVAFDLHLLSRGSVDQLLRNLLAHKCLMKMEDLIGHMHEEALGRAAGKERIPEPEGIISPDGKRDKETWHPTKNPYPGADARLGHKEFHQIKNKTGSAKGSDGEKLGRQFKQLAEKYPGSQRYYTSMLGKTLAGHRSMGAFLRKDPQAEVLVGLAAFQQLGGHRDTPKIVLDLYREIFEEVARDLHFDFQKILDGIVAEWKAKHGDRDAAHKMLIDVIVPDDPSAQSSRTYGQNPKVSRKKKSGPILF